MSANDRTGPSAYEPRPGHRPATTSTDRLRNLYQTGSEDGDDPPDNGESFNGLERRPPGRAS